jgi:hypothetical protein
LLLLPICDDPEVWKVIEGSSGYGMITRDVSDVIRRELPLTKNKKLYFSENPNLVVEAIKFRPVAGITGALEPYGLYTTDDSEMHMVIQRSNLIYQRKIWPLPDEMFSRVAEDAGNTA